VSEIDERIVSAYCPICQTSVPLITVTFITEGRWRKRITTIIEGDGTDYVAHMWAHSLGTVDPV